MIEQAGHVAADPGMGCIFMLFVTNMTFYGKFVLLTHSKITEGLMCAQGGGHPWRH